MKISRYCAIFCLILLASCEFGADNSPVPGKDTPETIPGGEYPPKQPEMGSVLITIINPGGYLTPAERTLLPPSPQFSRYAVSFIPMSSQETKEPETFYTDTGRKFNLDAGRWGISVEGFNGNDTVVAQGSNEVTVVSNTGIAVEIQLEEIPPGGRDGEFGWDISVKPGVSVDSWSLTLSQWGNELNNRLTLPAPGDTGVPPVAGSRSVPSGFYVMRVSFRLGGQMFVFDEITHVYPDRTTTFTYQITGMEFLPSLTLSGTLQVTATLNGNPVTPIVRRVWLYNNQNERIALAAVDGSGAWTTAVVKPVSPQEIHFTAELDILGHTREIIVTGVTRTIQDTDVSGITLSMHFPGILLQGAITFFTDITVSITKAGWDVSAYTDPDNPHSSALSLSPAITDSNGGWEMLIPAFATPEYVYFNIERIYNNQTYRREKLGRTTVHNNSVEGIALSGNFRTPNQVKISGTLPSLNNWTVSKPMNHQSQKTFFVYSQQTLPNNGALYEITFTAHWDNPASDTEYTFDTIVGEEPPPAYLSNYGEGSANGGISWIHYTADTNKAKNLLFTLDFNNNEYLSADKPSLVIRKRDETAVLLSSQTVVFIMGSPAAEAGRNGPSGLSSETQHYVRLTKNILVMDTEVTQSIYKELVPAYTITPESANYPVVNITWLDAVKFANSFSEKYGLQPVYTIPDSADSSGRGVTAEWNANGWRLPTESEWEFAARAGTSTKFSTGNTITTAQANFSNAEGHIVNAASYPPNPWGLYDMHGNAWEFCWDWYSDYPTGTTQTAPAIDPRGGPQENFDGNNGEHHTGPMDNPPPNYQRIIRGGGYYNTDRFLRSAHRGVMDVTRSNDIGFRLVRLAD